MHVIAFKITLKTKTNQGLFIKDQDKDKDFTIGDKDKSKDCNFVLKDKDED